MITQMSKKISSFFITSNIIKKEDREVYEYSLELLLSTVLNLIAVLAISILTGRVVETVLYLLGFIPLRTVAGGYHAKTHLRCFFLLMVTYLLFLLLLDLIEQNWMEWITMGALVVSLVLVFWLSPVEDSNKPLSEDERNILRFKSKLSIMLYSTACLLFVLIAQNPIYGLSLSLGILSVSLSQLAKVIQTRLSLMPQRH